MPSNSSIDPKKLAGWLALATLVAVVWTPPEAFGSGRMLLVLGATFAFLILVLDGGVARNYLAGGLAAFALLAGHSVLLSQDPYRSVDFLFTLWPYYCLFGFFYFSRTDMRRPVALTIILSGTGVAAYGVYQYLFGLEQLYNFVFYSEAQETVRVPILERVATERIFSTFALPGTLWGFLILAIPLHGFFWTPGRTLRNALIALNILLLLAATVLTQSYGMLVGLGVLAAGWYWTRPEGRSPGRVLLYTLPLLPAALGVYAMRASAHNPISLRLQNWLSAWEIFAAHPWGSGLDTYAVLYLQHQQLGANETQFAHNTPIQLLAELGIVGLAGGLVLLFRFSRQWRGLRARWVPGSERFMLLGVLVWLAHNLIEINVYFASIGTIGVALIALLAWRRDAPFAPVAAPSRSRLAQATAVAGILAVIGGAGIYLSGELLHRSRIEIEDRKLEAAAATLEMAARINPYDSSIFHEAGQVSLELYHMTHEPFRIANAERFFRRAIDLSPRKVGPYVGLGLSLSTLDRTAEALVEIGTAQRLHPAGEQAYAIRRMVERRHLELARVLEDSPPIN